MTLRMWLPQALLHRLDVREDQVGVPAFRAPMLMTMSISDAPFRWLPWPQNL